MAEEELSPFSMPLLDVVSLLDGDCWGRDEAEPIVQGKLNGIEEQSKSRAREAESKNGVGNEVRDEVLKCLYACDKGMGRALSDR